MDPLENQFKKRTSKSLNDCLRHFYSYPTMDVINQFESEQPRLPKITICQNSIHSKRLT